MSEIKAQHTPGPWVVYLDTKVTTAPKHHGMHGSLHEVIADCSRNSQWTGKRDEIAEANARLIAAAPELLEACRTAFDFIDGIENFNDEAKEAIKELKAEVETLKGNK